MSIVIAQETENHATFATFDTLPVTIGRGFGNDLILQDLFVSPSHVRIEAREGGGFIVIDLGSENGTQIDGKKMTTGQMLVASGARVTIGQSDLKLYARDHAVAPTQNQRVQGYTRAFLEKKYLAWVLFPLALAMMALQSYYAEWNGAAGREAGYSALFAGAMITSWALVWGIAGAALRRKSAVMGHVAAASLYVLVAFAARLVADYAGFIFSFSPDVMAVVFDFVMFGFLVAAGFALATNYVRRKRMMIGFTMSFAMMFAYFAIEILSVNDFEPVPSYLSTLKPHFWQVAPAVDSTQFMQEAGALMDGLEIPKSPKK